jgi:hypothetical protein
MLTAGLVFVLLFMTISILSRQDSVQEWYGHKIADYLSSRTGFPVEMGITEASFFRGIVIHDLKITDRSGESMAEVKEIETSLRKNLFSLLFHNRINLEDIRISDARINMLKSPDEDRSNLEVFLAAFGNDESGETDCRELAIRRIKLENIEFHQRIRPHQELNASIGKARVNFRQIDLCNQRIDIDELFLDSGSLELTMESRDTAAVKSIPEAGDSLVKDTMQILVRHLVLDNGEFRFSNKNKARPEGYSGIDFNALDLEKIAMEARDLQINSVFEAQFELEQLAFREGSGFILDRMSVEKGQLNGSRLILDQVIMQTPGSLIRHNLTMTYRELRDFTRFSDRVSLNIDFSDCKLLPEDLFYFAAPLAKNEFFRENRNELIRLDGSISGRLNALKGRDIRLYLEDQSYLSGDFSSRNLTVAGEQLMNIRLNEFTSGTETIAKLLPGISFNPAFYRLGRLSFRGAFDGYFHDFVAFGALQTDLGAMEMDMRLNLSNGPSLAEYSGNFGLSDFALGQLTEVEDLGKISLNAQVISGQGLNINTVNADLFARVDSLEFRGHTYRNLLMDGYLDKDLFNGDFSIDGQFIKINLSGFVNYGDSIPSYRFDARINHLDLYKLNLSRHPLKLSSHLGINLQGSNLNNIDGRVVAHDLRLSNAKKSILLDSVVVSSVLGTNQERYLDLSSEVLSFYFDGYYQLNKIPDAILDVLKYNHPKLFQSVPYLGNTLDNPPFYYDFYVYIPDSRMLFEVIQPTTAHVTEMVLSGHVDHRQSLFDINSSIEALELSDIRLNRFHANIDLFEDDGEIRLLAENVHYGSTSSDSLFFLASIARNTLNYSIRLDTIDDKLKRISIAAVTKPHEQGFETNILNGNILFLNDNWYVRNDNRIVLGNRYIDLENLSLVNGLNELSLDDINEHRGVKAVISGLEIGILNAFLNSEKVRFSGRSEGFVLLPEMYRDKKFEGAVRVRELFVNGDPYGQFTSVVQLDQQNKQKLSFTGTLDNQLHSVNYLGSYDLKERYFDLGIEAERFPLAFLEYLIEDGISGTEGYGNGNIRFFGPAGQIQVAGQARAFECKTTINYLGTTYFANDQLVNLSTDYIDFTGVSLTDISGNPATVSGGLKHRLFKNIELDLTIQSPRITGLNTTREMNPYYFGKGIGSLNARFSGPIQKATISLDAEVFPGSKLTIPVRSETEVSQTSFIRFVSENTGQSGPRINGTRDITGVDLDMNLSILPGAEVEIILDENAGDNIRGTGTGDIRLEITRTGGFEMYGNFYIDRGTYLFTALTLIQKPFTIRQGGRITWTGDPLDATIDLLADYKGERVALDNFIKEYTINNEILAQKARKRTDVDLLLHLTGSLLHPAVSFDLNFPNLDGDIKSYVFSKLQKLRADQNLMYTQAVTLLSLGAFLPQDNLSGLVSPENNVSTAATGLHTGLQYSAVLLSRYLTGLFDELFAQSNWISGVDIDINVINSQAFGLERDNIWPNEYTYDARLHLFEDKASVEFSGSYVNRGILDPNQSYANGDFIFRYYFTDDRKLRIEVYSKREYDEYLTEWKWKIGTGLNYQMQFGSIYDMKRDVEEDIRETSRENIN